MNKLVSESLTEYIGTENVNEETMNEVVDPAAIQMLAGSLAVLLASGGLGVLHDKLKNSDNKISQKIAAGLEKVGSAAGKSIKGGSTSSVGESIDKSFGRKLNENLDPAMIEMASIAAGTLGSVIAAGGLAVLIDKLQNSENPKAKKFAAFLGKLGKGAKQGAEG